MSKNSDETIFNPGKLFHHYTTSLSLFLFFCLLNKIKKNIRKAYFIYISMSNCSHETIYLLKKKEKKKKRRDEKQINV